MFQRVKIKDWNVEVDRESTEQANRQQAAKSVTCSCSYCAWFQAHRTELFPNEFLAILHTLGIDSTKDVEIAEAHEDPKWAFYEGWFHANGRLLNGPSKDVPLNIGSRENRWRILDFSIRVTDKQDLAKADFPRPIVQVEFSANFWIQQPNWRDRLKQQWLRWKVKLKGTSKPPMKIGKEEPSGN